MFGQTQQITKREIILDYEYEYIVIRILSILRVSFFVRVVSIKAQSGVFGRFFDLLRIYKFSICTRPPKYVHMFTTTRKNEVENDLQTLFFKKAKTLANVEKQRANNYIAILM